MGLTLTKITSILVCLFGNTARIKNYIVFALKGLRAGSLLNVVADFPAEPALRTATTICLSPYQIHTYMAFG